MEFHGRKQVNAAPLADLVAFSRAGVRYCCHHVFDLYYESVSLITKVSGIGPGMPNLVQIQGCSPALVVAHSLGYSIHL